MAEPKWHKLRRQLLFGGIPFWRINRAVSELQDHYYELEREALEAGLSRSEAQQEASGRIGNESQIAEGLLARPELKGWWANVPGVSTGVAYAGMLGGVAEFEIDHNSPYYRWGMTIWYATVFTSLYLYTLRVALTG